MINWWEAREQREKLLILLAALLLAVALIQQWLVSPLLSAHQEARSEHERAVQALEVVMSEKQMIESRFAEETEKRRAANLSQDALRGALTGLATQRGIQVAQLRSTTGEGFSISMENVDPPQFFAWLSEAETMFGVEVTSAAISQSAGGGLRVTVDFAGEGQ